MLQEEPSSSDRSGQPDREGEKRVRNHDRSGQPDREERLHKVQEDCHLRNRDDADKFNLAMDDENIDFNISGIPDATVKRSQSFNIHDLIQRIAIIHKKKQFRMISNNINPSIHSATSQKLQSWMQGTLSYARLSTWSRSGNARCVLSIAVQELYTAHVDIL